MPNPRLHPRSDKSVDARILGILADPEQGRRYTASWSYRHDTSEFDVSSRYNDQYGAYPSATFRSKAVQCRKRHACESCPRHMLSLAPFHPNDFAYQTMKLMKDFDTIDKRPWHGGMFDGRLWK